MKRIHFATAATLLAIACLIGNETASAATTINPIDPSKFAVPWAPHRLIVASRARAMVDDVLPGDFDGDMKADLSVKHDSGAWTYDLAANGFASGSWEQTRGPFEVENSIAVPADFDGDGKTDMSVFWNGPCNAGAVREGCWCISYSAQNSGDFCYDVKRLDIAEPVPADYDGDGKADLAILEKSGAWRIDLSSNGFGFQTNEDPNEQWQLNFQMTLGPGAVPVPADYDGDGYADLSVKDVLGHWYIDYAKPSDSPPIAYSTSPTGPIYFELNFGAWNATYSGYGWADAHPVPADYDGDRKADLSVKNDGGEWHIDFARDGFGVWNINLWGYGGPAFRPVPADYDGDGLDDLAIRYDYGDWVIDYGADGFGNISLGDTTLVLTGAVNPDKITLSPYSSVTADLTAFDSQWMNQYQTTKWEGLAESLKPDLACPTLQSLPKAAHLCWGLSERMWAMVRMYETTRDRRYVDHLHKMAMSVLAARDDHQPANPMCDDPVNSAKYPARGRFNDAYRYNAVQPAWGVEGLASGWYHTVDITIAAMLSHPIAAFARIVAEDPALLNCTGLSGTALVDCQKLGPDAIQAAREIRETVLMFSDLELRKQLGKDGKLEKYFVVPKYRDVLTLARCDEAKAFTKWLNPDMTDKALGDAYEDCVDATRAAGDEHATSGGPIAHNENQAMNLVMIELARALDSDFYRAQSDDAEILVSYGQARNRFPLDIAALHRYWANRWIICPGASDSAFNEDEGTARDICKLTSTSYVHWHHGDQPDGSGRTRLDDTNHSALLMRYVGVLNNNKPRLDNLLAAYQQSIKLDSVDTQRFSNLFRVRIANGTYFAGSQLGTTAPTGTATANSWDATCDGWVNLAVADPWVWTRCQTATFASYVPALDSENKTQAIQPILSFSNHAAMLAMKKFSGLPSLKTYYPPKTWMYD